MRSLSILPVLALLWVNSVFAAEAPWLTDFAKAQALAAAEKKDLLLDFTGSSWCPPCIQLKREVFDQEVFKTQSSKNFVLVELDFPQAPATVPPGGQNDLLQRQYGITAFPTIVLAEANGRPYAKTTYRPGGAEGYLQHLESFGQAKRRRDEAWKKAEGVQGIERAKLLLAGLKEMEEELAVENYADVIGEVVKLDSQNETGVAMGLGFEADVNVYGRKMEEAARTDRGKMRATTDAFIAGHPQMNVEQKQRALTILLFFYRPPGDLKAVLDLTNEIVALDGESKLGKQAVGIRDQVAKRLKTP